ncbi:conjugative transfer signal peptidase TraF [Photobacterium damselae]|uniref:conjugative transfer signal peptidase TraF n=1 Tax=Photobacterium damselae TaxID=38293 RepID=UPI0002B615B8|nr:conjugative transfer signal peptidase TraF [Photobacterium damselae]AGE91747.1 TraF [Photobacterium damselae subsp. piscicida DI21]
MKKKLMIGLPIALFFLMIEFHQGYRINLSISYPPGIYKITSQGQYNKGDLVLFCPPNIPSVHEAMSRGYLGFSFECESGIMPTVKKIFGLSGDKISLDTFVYINNQLVPYTTILSQDSKQRPLPKLNDFTVPRHSVFLLSDHLPTVSFDSRYYGAVSLERVISHIEPIYTW